MRLWNRAAQPGVAEVQAIEVAGLVTGEKPEVSGMPTQVEGFFQLRLGTRPLVAAADDGGGDAAGAYGGGRDHYLAEAAARGEAFGGLDAHPYGKYTTPRNITTARISARAVASAADERAGATVWGEGIGESVQSAIEAALPQLGRVAVTRERVADYCTGRPRCSGFTWRVTFATLMGDTPPLEVARHNLTLRDGAAVPGGHIRASTIRSGAGGTTAHERFDVAAKLYPCHVLLFGAGGVPDGDGTAFASLADAKAAAVWSVRLDDRHADGGERARIITVLPHAICKRIR